MRKNVLIFNDPAADMSYTINRLYSVGYSPDDLYVSLSTDDIPTLSVDSPDLILINISVYDAGTLDLLTLVKQFYPNVAVVIIIPNTDDAYIPVKIIREGIDNYLLDGVFTADALGTTIQHVRFNKKMITDYEQAKKDLLVLEKSYREEKKLLNEILSGIEEIIWAVDPATFKLLYTNKACYHVYGYTPEEMIADENIFLSAVLPEDMEGFKQCIKKAYRVGECEHEFRVRHKDGSIKTLRGHGRVKYDDNQHPVMLSGIATDITALRATEDLMTEQLEHIKQQRDTLQEIAWIQSHKMRGPVASIKGLATLFNYDDPAHPDNIEILKKFETASEYMDNMIKEITDKTSSHNLDCLIK